MFLGSSNSPDRRLRILILAHLMWLSVVCLLGGWWGYLMMSQAKKIADLEGRLGWATEVAQNQWMRTQRMLFWESGTFFALLLACSGLLFWVYWRDVKRARGIQAFFASVTHELRTPLTSIRLQAETIADSIPDSQHHRRLLGRLLEDTIRLEAQVERTLELARVEGGGPVYTQALEVKPWLDRFLKSWSADYRERVEVSTRIEDVLIQADPTAMQIIFKNLLENSVRHSKKEKVQISISCGPKEKGVSFRMIDDGQGYRGDKASLGRVFQKGPTSPGTGVGLYLVKVLMKKMGGFAEFSLAPHLDSGFEVLLWFPEGKFNG